MRRQSNPRLSWLLALLTLLGVFAGGCGLSPSAPKSAAPPPVGEEPAATVAFISAFARGDETQAERVASPLYAQEWDRRGVSESDRLSWHSRATQASTDGDWLAFQYVGGVTGASGRHHLLFTGASVGALGTPTRTVWRFDTDQQGRVIWGEMVYLFSDQVTSLTPQIETPSPGAALSPSVLDRFHPSVVVGIHSASSSEGYFALVTGEKPAGSPSKTAASNTISVTFLAVDSDGEVRPGVWSYFDG